MATEHLSAYGAWTHTPSAEYVYIKSLPPLCPDCRTIMRKVWRSDAFDRWTPYWRCECEVAESQLDMLKQLLENPQEANNAPIP